MPKKKKTTRKSDYNENRPCYLSSDGKYYCYRVWDENTHKEVEVKYEVGTDGFTLDLTILLDETDHEHDLNDRYQRRMCDAAFEKKCTCYEADPDGDFTDPWNEVGDYTYDPAEILTQEEEQGDPLVEKVREIVDTQFTDDQEDLYYRHYGMGQQFEQIRQEEAKRTGKLPGASAMTGRKNRMLNRVAKALGAEPPKPRKK